MRYAILGTTQALRDDGTPAALGGPRLRALLTVFAARPGRPLPTDLLVGEVWGGDPPADATAALQALVGRLRRALGHSAVESVEGGYRLAATREDVDLFRFERLAGEGARALEAGAAGEAAARYEEALALWRGPALADLPDRSAEAVRWDAVRLDVRRGRLAAALAAGEAERALPELTALCAERPLDEPLQGLRIRALRDAGRAAEALAAYESVRRELAARLGTTPGPDLRSLHTDLLTPATPPPYPAPPARPQAVPSHPQSPPAARPPGVQHPASPADPAQHPASPAHPGAAPPASAAQPPASPGGAPGRSRGEFEARGSGRSPEQPGSAGHRAPPGPAPQTPAGLEVAPDAGLDGAPEAPVGLGVAPEALGAGSGRSAELGVAPGAPGARGAGGGGERPYGNVRARLTTFVGREGDIVAIGDDLRRARLVTLLGPGGAGKTRLSQEAAEAAAPAGHWPDGVWLAELAPVEDPDDVAEAVLSTLGVREGSRRGVASEELRVLTDRHDDAMLRLTEYCARRRMLLLLDNCEHVVDAAARLAEDLLAHCPGVQVLATSREPLGVPGETLRPVEPLPDPMALRLLADRGAAARPGFSPDEDPEAAAEICRRLDGLPLAIELAAARLRLLSPRQIADRLDDRFRLLTSGSRTVLPRQQTLRAVVDWSWDLLEEPERAVLRRLSVCAGGCDLAAAETVCADGDTLDPLDVADVLGSLVDKSLVVAAAGAGGEMRYRLLETVGEYAAERLDAAGPDRAATERRHLVHYRELARRTEPLLRGRTQRAAAALLRTEYENLRTALRRAAAARDEGEMMCLVHSMVWYWHMHDLRAESRHWSRAAAALGPDPFAPPVAPVPPVHEQVVDSAPPYAGELLAEARRGIRLIELASRDQSTADWQSPEVRALIQGIVSAYRPGLPQLCRNPGGLWFYAVMIAGDAGLLKEVIDANVEACRAFGYTWDLASALQLRANVLANRADWVGSATRDAEESLALFADLGDDWGCAEALSARGEARERRGEFAAAAEDFRAAGEYARRLGAEAQETVLRVRLAGVLAELGEGEEAEEILAEVVATRQQFGNEAMPAARMFLATRLARTGRTGEARAQLRSLRDEFAFGAYAIFDGFLLGMMAWLDNLEGRYEDALPSLRQAMEAAADPLVQMVAPQMPAVYLMTAAGSLAGLGGVERARDAARLLGAYRALLPAGHFPTLIEREGSAVAEEGARLQLGDAAYEAAYAEGGALTLEEAAALV